MNEDSFVREEKRELGKEVKEFSFSSKRNMRKGLNMERVMEFSKVCEVIKKP